ncbi:MAG: TlpA disulfide reductase family protein [Thermodesulfobacteriota bacterium]
MIANPRSAARALTLALLLTIIGGLAPAQAGTKMPAFTLDDVKTDEPVASSTFAGKAKLVVFFATWCMPCMQEVPALISLQEEYGPKGFTVIAISVDRRAMDVKRFLNRTEVNYPILMADKKIVKAFGGIPGLPTSFLVNSDDTVLKKMPGLRPHAQLEREINSVLSASE